MPRNWKTCCVITKERGCTCRQGAAGEQGDGEHLREAEALSGAFVGEQAVAAEQALARVAAECGHLDHSLVLVRLAASKAHGQHITQASMKPPA